MSMLRRVLVSGHLEEGHRNEIDSFIATGVFFSAGFGLLLFFVVRRCLQLYALTNNVGGEELAIE